MKPQDITVEEWLKELERLSAAPGFDGLTALELSVRCGNSRAWVSRYLLHPAQKAGRLVVGRKMMQNIAGFKSWLPAYKFKRK